LLAGGTCRLQPLTLYVGCKYATVNAAELMHIEGSSTEVSEALWHQKTICPELIIMERLIA